MVNNKKFVLKFFGIDWEEEKKNREFLDNLFKKWKKLRYTRHYRIIKGATTSITVMELLTNRCLLTIFVRLNYFRF